ncbi:hypothetical protein SUGI_0788800 [Cryptomeria japonica]|nr:hypothetical protein SUGI_0788800 [Cryptomeria japonica]
MEEELSRRQTKEWVQMYFVVSTLLVTVTFATVFQIPGGVKSETGIPVRNDAKAFKFFILFNSLALTCSMMVLILAFNVYKALFKIERDKSDAGVKLTGTSTWADFLLQLAFMFTALSYSSCLFVLKVPLHLLLAFLVCSTSVWGIVWQMVLHFRGRNGDRNGDGSSQYVVRDSYHS